MKKLVFVLFLLVFTIINIQAQALSWEENFNFTSTGNLKTLATNWESNSGSVPIQVIEGNLSYSDYPSSGIGKKIVVKGGATGRERITREFTSVSENGNSIYVSFLMNISSDGLDYMDLDGDYFLNLDGNALKAKVYVKKSTIMGKYLVGIAKTIVPTYSSIVLSQNETYLIVLSYNFLTGDDLLKLWINPLLSSTEPLASVTISTGADATELSSLQIRENPKSGHIDLDGIRVASGWMQAPLPVELTTFTANQTNSSITLNWETATEVNNYGFEVGRQLLVNSNQLAEWEKIGFVEGHGNSNSPKYYKYIDNTVSASGIYNYRLKQIDTDGGFEYFNLDGIEFNVAENYELDQNFPNPFNPVTNITYSIPRDGFVTLEIFNLIGEKVTTLVNKKQSAGVYKQKFDASKLNSGFYIYKITANQFSEAKKMLLIK
ncbi:MAG: T9SS type A sorting domain-containing protein [Melioribacteraceae bacterium]|nr:T9SS type A sorting domain-containing protein [Melioribacteraceae bacterium]